MLLEDQGRKSSYDYNKNNIYVSDIILWFYLLQ